MHIQQVVILLLSYNLRLIFSAIDSYCWSADAVIPNENEQLLLFRHSRNLECGLQETGDFYSEY